MRHGSGNRKPSTDKGSSRLNEMGIDILIRCQAAGCPMWKPAPSVVWLRCSHASPSMPLFFSSVARVCAVWGGISACRSRTPQKTYIVCCRPKIVALLKVPPVADRPYHPPLVTPVLSFQCEWEQVHRYQSLSTISWWNLDFSKHSAKSFQPAHASDSLILIEVNLFKPLSTTSIAVSTSRLINFLAFWDYTLLLLYGSSSKQFQKDCYDISLFPVNFSMLAWVEWAIGI